MNGCQRHVAEGQIVRKKMIKHLGLNFSDQTWSELLELIDAKVRLDLRRKPISRRKVKAESKAVKSAALKLLHTFDPKTLNEIEWRILLSCSGELGDWQTINDRMIEMLKRLTRICEIVDDREASSDGDQEHGGRPTDFHRANFATTLSNHFIRAGGTFQQGGRAGFPQFLKFVWEMLPDGHRSNSAESFSDSIGRAVNGDGWRASSPAHATYLLGLTRTYWGLPCS